MICNTALDTSSSAEVSQLSVNPFLRKASNTRPGTFLWTYNRQQLAAWISASRPCHGVTADVNTPGCVQMWKPAQGSLVLPGHSLESRRKEPEVKCHHRQLSSSHSSCPLPHFAPQLCIGGILNRHIFCTDAFNLLGVAIDSSSILLFSCSCFGSDFFSPFLFNLGVSH